MDRAEFNPFLVGLHFVSVGGQCECEGCFPGHYGRCSARFTLSDRATSDSDFGWQADHRWGAWSNDATNLRILCVDCHKRTPSYGRNVSSRGLGALSFLGAPASSLEPLAAAYAPVSVRAPNAPATTDWVSALLAPAPPATDPISALVRALMGEGKR